MIIVSELYRVGDEHVPVNSSLLFILSGIYSDQQVVFWSSKLHSEAVHAFLKGKGIVIHNVTFKEVPSRNIRLPLTPYMKKVANEVRNIRSLHRVVKQVRPERVFFLSISPFTSAVFHKLMYNDSYRAWIVLHGDLEFIRLNKTRLRNHLGRCLRSALSTGHKRLQYIVLDHLIKRNLVKTGLVHEDRVLSLPHPYIFDAHPSTVATAETFTNQPLQIGMIGVASMEKNAHLVFELAARFRDQCQSGKLHFTIIGKNENIPPYLQNDLVKIAGEEGMLTRSIFEEMIQCIHFSLFFYQNDAYQFSCSGALLDAIEFEKPLVAFRNDLFESIFSVAGEMGYLCDTVDEMYILIQQFTDGNIDINRYNGMKANMQTYKHMTTLEVLGHQLARDLK